MNAPVESTAGRRSPEALTLVFDGPCAACNRWVAFLLRRDAAGRFRFGSTRSAYGRAVLVELGEDPDDPATVVLLAGSRVYRRSDAILRATAALGGGWRLVSLFRLVPRPFRDAAYAGFARNRYRWFGRATRCAADDARWTGRFIQ